MIKSCFNKFISKITNTLVKQLQKMTVHSDSEEETSIYKKMFLANIP